MRESASSKTINFMAPGSGVLVLWQSLILCREVWFHFDWLSFSYLRFAQLCHRMLCNNFQKKKLNESFFGINSMNNKNDFISLVIVMHINIHCKSHTAFTQVTNKTHGPLIKCNMKAKTWILVTPDIVLIDLIIIFWLYLEHQIALNLLIYSY